MILYPVDVLRHGECEGGDIFRGSTDVALSAQGEETMRNQLAAHGQDYALIASSPLRRCREFATEVAESRSLPLTVIDGFREMHFGEWEGQQRTAVAEREAQFHSAWLADPETHTPPGAEPLHQVYERVADAMATLVAHPVIQDTQAPTLLVCHGGIIRTLMALALALPLSSARRLAVPYGCVTRLWFAQDPRQGGYLEQHNLPKHG